MIRTILDLPRPLLRLTRVDWDIDWRGQSGGGDARGGEQIVYNAFPRFIGSPQLRLTREMIPHWRALRARAQGRVNAWRVPMIDPAGFEAESGSWASDWQAWIAGQYVAPRPQVLAVGASAAGATSITVDERAAPQPVRVGQFLSWRDADGRDRPFLVTTRSGSGASVSLGVSMLRVALADGAQIDLAACGVFVAANDTMGRAEYGPGRTADLATDFIEWIT